MFAIKRFSVSFLVLAVVLGCTTDPYTGKKQVSRAVIGAGAGALVGAGIGALAGRDGRSALIGAGVGALAGGAVGGYMDLQEAKLRKQLQGTGVSVTRTGDKIVLNMPGNVTFQTDRSDIEAGFYEVLNSVALVLNEYEKTVIHVTGHTDSTGTYEHNMGLSQRRADSVAGYLRAQKVLSGRVVTKGFGPDQAIASNDTPEGRQLNRRVEITLVPFTG